MSTKESASSNMDNMELEAKLKVLNAEMDELKKENAKEKELETKYNSLLKEFELNEKASLKDTKEIEKLK